MPPPESGVDPMRPRLYRVRRAWRELGDTAGLELVPEHGGPAPRCDPGQFNMLYAFGIGEAAISVSRRAGDGFVHTVRELGPVSRALGALAPGAMLGLRGPFGRGWPLRECRGRDLVFIAGGLGLAPLRPALDAVLAARADYARVALLVGARQPDQLLYAQELAAWSARGDLQVLVTVDHADASWRGRVGVVPALLPYATFDPMRTTAMLCGPEAMMRFSAHALRGAGVAARDVHLSMERNMQCGCGLCGHCQFGPYFICRDGPVMRLDQVEPLLGCREI
jgi:NAD(P)H-flavin reductase